MFDKSVAVRVKRDGPRGWHWIGRAKYDADPKAFELIDGHVAAPAAVPNPGGEPVDIPADWETLHWSQQEKLALSIVGGGGPLVPAQGQTRAEKAKAIIGAEVSKRLG